MVTSDIFSKSDDKGLGSNTFTKENTEAWRELF